MLKNISFLAMAGALAFATSMTGCIIVTDDTGTTLGDADQGDGDGDSETAGDADADADAGDGDGDGDADAGDGDGDADAGDGDGDADAGDGDGDTGGGACGWVEDQGYYICGGEGEDPSGTNPLACPEGLNQGDPCDAVEPVLTDIGCCDAQGNNWYCATDDPDDPEAPTYQNMDACG